MLEATIVLEVLVHKLDEAIIIGVLLLFNSVLSFVQENQANRALALLRKRLSVQARALRDGRWQLIPAEKLVPEAKNDQYALVTTIPASNAIL